MILTSLDIVILIILLLCFVIGCARGLVVQLYDISVLVLSFVVSLIINEYVSNYISIFPFSKSTIIYTMIFEKAETYIAFIISFIAIYALLKILGLVIKPFLKRTTKILKTTSILNRLTGGLLSIIKGSVFIYFLIILLMMPMFSTKSYCEESILCQYIVEYIPYTKEYVNDIEEFSLIHLSNDDDLLSTMINGYKLNIISNERFIEIFDKHILHSNSDTIYTLTSSDLELTKTILRTKYALPAIQPVLNRIEVKNE